MVFHQFPTPMYPRLINYNHLSDTSSVASTIDKFSGTKGPKIDPEKQNNVHHDEWHVVPRGDAKTTKQIEKEKESIPLSIRQM
jgi:hypothetical protein